MHLSNVVKFRLRSSAASPDKRRGQRIAEGMVAVGARKGQWRKFVRAYWEQPRGDHFFMSMFAP